MKKEKIPSADRQPLEIIFADYVFFFRAICRNKIVLGAEKKKRLQKLIEERDFYSIKQLIRESEESK